MSPDRIGTLRACVARYVQAQMAADHWRREAAERRALLSKMLRDAREADPGLTDWPADLKAILAYEVDEHE